MRVKKHSVGRKKTHVKTHRTKTLTPVQIARAKWRIAVLKSKQINRDWKNKLAEKTVEFKRKLDELAQKAYERAVETVSAETRRRIEAKAKAIALAEAKFEKKFVKLLARKTKRRTKGKRHINITHGHTTATHTTATTKRVGKRRGRKTTRHHVVGKTVTIGHQATTKKRGRRPGRKTTLHVTTHRMTTGHTKRRGRPAKHRAHTTVTTAHRRRIKR
jgi:hypothetical protein